MLLTTRVEARGPAGALVLTGEQVAALGGGKRAPVVVTIGDTTARLRIAMMGGEALIGLSKAARAALGVQIGDLVTANISLDVDPREVEVPAELAAALADVPDAADHFAALSYTHRREFCTWVSEAKQQATRDRRAKKAVDMLREGRTR